MTSDVFFADFRARAWKANKISRIRELFDKAGFAGLIPPKALTAVKVHFGESGNDTYLNPLFARQVVDKIKEADGKPFITDTNTLYRGKRDNALDHIITAIEHGYAYSVVGAPVIIADGLKRNHSRDVFIGKKHFEKVRIAGDILDADSMIVLSHFKGHELAGFGGAIKNLAMGCAPYSGKKDQHQLCMQVDAEKCVGCGTCEEFCPTGAAKVLEGKSSIKRELCLGCGECLAVCPEKCISTDWTTEVVPFVERLTEYALGAISGKQGRVGYMNFLLNITPDCDCVPWSDKPIVPDVGILASLDPVALDKACLDLVNQQTGASGSLLKNNLEPGQDKFTGLWSHTHGMVQLSYGAQLGLGSLDYHLIAL